MAEKQDVEEKKRRRSRMRMKTWASERANEREKKKNIEEKRVGKR